MQTYGSKINEKTSNTAILAATIMVAGLFAFAPVEQQAQFITQMFLTLHPHY